MLMQTKSITDRQILWFTGFITTQFTAKGVISQPDINKICNFFLVSPRTARRWIKSGFPEKARHQLEMLYAGDFLPSAWKQAGLKVCSDGVLLADGRLLGIGVMQFWPFLMQAVNWDKVPKLVIERSN